MENKDMQFHATRLIQMVEERKSLEEKIAQEKQIIEKMLIESGEEIVRFPFTEDKDIKVERTFKRQTKLDKEGIADELDITEENVKPEVIMKKIDERKFTFDRYKEHKYQDEVYGTSIKLVKIEKKKKNKK